MQKLKVLAVTLALIMSYASPVLITKADNSSTVITPVPESKPQQMLHLRITAYSSSVDETDDTPFITASGKTVRDGIVATNLLPLGTKVQIPALFGDKIFTVEDRMNKRFQQSLDIWMVSKAKAIYFGVRHADIVVLGDSALSLK